MDGESISKAFSASARAVYQYLDDMQFVEDPPKGVSEIQATGWDIRDDFAVLHLASRLSDTSGLMLRVNGTVVSEEESGFSRYDDFSKTILVRPPSHVLESMCDGSCSVSVLSDMKFLLRAVGDFYERYGSLIRPPDRGADILLPSYPEGCDPTEEQRIAAEGILSSDMSYVWGAPGTGKTQFVLSSAIRACIEAGERVAVFAPTNNSVEQVLNGVMKAVPQCESYGILRIGVPSKDFFMRHPDMCEDRQIQKLIDREHSFLDVLEEVRFERICDSMRDDLDLLEGCSDDIGGLDELEMRPDLAAAFESVKAVCRLDSEAQSVLLSYDDPGSIFRELRRVLFERPRPALLITEYSDMSDSEIAERIASSEDTLEKLSKQTTSSRASDAGIIAATPHQFVSRFRPRGSEDDGRMELDVDRIFLDEAGYCGLVLALALFSNGVPVVMLGDHMQLPPVTELDADDLRAWASARCRMSDAFLWSMPALFCERALESSLAGLRRDFLEGSAPTFVSTSRYDLTLTHRFGGNLASVLDRYVYRNGLKGAGSDPMRLQCLDSVCGYRENRENAAEAESIKEFLKSEMPDPEDICILTPYSVQRTLLWKTVPRRYRDCVMTVHGSQGREWGTVILSVADNGIESRPVPFRFTSSSTAIGMRVINTAVSRAKRRLIIACDRCFWESRADELISGLLKECTDRARSERP